MGEKFYLGGRVDLERGALTSQPVFYNPSDLTTHDENVLSLLSGRRAGRRLTTSLTKRRLTEQARTDVDESVEALKVYREQLAQLQAERARLVEEINTKWGETVHNITQIAVRPKKSDISLRLFEIGWITLLSAFGWWEGD